jgi:hypothetical protein
MGQAEGDWNDSTPEHRKLIKPDGQMPVQILKGEKATRAGTEQSAGDVLHRLLGGFHIEE